VRRRLFLVAPSALLTDHLPHGDGLVACGFIRELASRGHELHVAAGRVELREGLPANVHLHRLGSGSRLGFMWSLRRLYRRLDASLRFDLLHQLNPVEVGVSLAVADVREPVVLGPYVPDWPTPGAHPAEPVKRALRAAQQRRAATVLVSTPAAACKLSAGARAHELPPGIDVQTWQPGNGGLGQDILFLGNLEPRKGIRLAVEAFARIAPELTAARLMIAGDGPEGESIRRRVQELPGGDRVSFLGHVDRRRAVAVMQACDLFCLPSYGEPFGMAALEAMACGRPIVATDAGGPRYLVPRQGGRKVPPGDVEALAAAMGDLLSDEPLRRAMGEHNRRLVEERYAWPRVADRLEEIYLEAASDRLRRNS
jgi:glycosyltransferase involved in cell wall biosynthesis